MGVITSKRKVALAAAPIENGNLHRRPILVEEEQGIEDINLDDIDQDDLSSTNLDLNEDLFQTAVVQVETGPTNDMKFNEASCTENSNINDEFRRESNRDAGKGNIEDEVMKNKRESDDGIVRSDGEQWMENNSEADDDNVINDDDKQRRENNTEAEHGPIHIDGELWSENKRDTNDGNENINEDEYRDDILTEELEVSGELETVEDNEGVDLFIMCSAPEIGYGQRGVTSTRTAGNEVSRRALPKFLAYTKGQRDTNASSLTDEINARIEGATLGAIGIDGAILEKDTNSKRHTANIDFFRSDMTLNHSSKVDSEPNAGNKVLNGGLFIKNVPKGEMPRRMPIFGGIK